MAISEEEINYSRNIIGCNIAGKIFVHPELHKNPRLYKAILKHEKKHSNGINGRDVAIDFFNDDIKSHKKEFYKFLLKHPRTFLGYLPVSKVGKYWCFDLELFVAWVFLILMVWFVGSNI